MITKMAVLLDGMPRATNSFDVFLDRAGRATDLFDVSVDRVGRITDLLDSFLGGGKEADLFDVF